MNIKKILTLLVGVLFVLCWIGVSRVRAEVVKDTKKSPSVTDRVLKEKLDAAWAAEAKAVAEAEAASIAEIEALADAKIADESFKTLRIFFVAVDAAAKRVAARAEVAKASEKIALAAIEAASAAENVARILLKKEKISEAMLKTEIEAIKKDIVLAETESNLHQKTAREFFTIAQQAFDQDDILRSIEFSTKANVEIEISKIAGEKLSAKKAVLREAEQKLELTVAAIKEESAKVEAMAEITRQMEARAVAEAEASKVEELEAKTLKEIVEQLQNKASAHAEAAKASAAWSGAKSMIAKQAAAQAMSEANAVKLIEQETEKIAKEKQLEREKAKMLLLEMEKAMKNYR